MSQHTLSSYTGIKDRPMLRRIETLISKFVRPPRVQPEIRTPSHRSAAKSMVVDDPIHITPLLLDDAFSVMAPTQKPKSNSFNYNVYMKCFIHELRTPISTITMGLEVLKKSSTDPKMLQTIQDIYQSTTFVDNILTKFAIVEEGNIELNEFEPFDLHMLITNVHVLLLYQFKEPDLNFTQYVDATLPIWTYGDAHNIKHVLLNLLKNAIKYRNPARSNTIR